MRDGTFWASAGRPEQTGETYDLVVVGAGISGLASAYFYSRLNPNARILILDNNDDFGGHARRNEFNGVAGRPGGMLMTFGGAESIEAPNRWSRQAMSLLEGIGIEVERLLKHFDDSFYPGHSISFFDKETWGRDHTAIITPWLPLSESLKGARWPRRRSAISTYSSRTHRTGCRVFPTGRRRNASPR
ncbi:MAG: FAD-dependent oxidoreductase [Actinomycetota bacterium]